MIGKDKRFALFLLVVLLWGAACSRPLTDEQPDSGDAPTPSQGALVAARPTAVSHPTPDPAIFHPGLVNDEQSALHNLTGAPIYVMTLVVEPDLGTISGSQTIYYTNNSDTLLHDLYLHLLPNLLGGRIEVQHVAVNGRSLIPLYTEFNDSVMRLPLSAPLAAGESLIIEMEYVTAVPQETGRNYGIFAQSQGVMALAHFFPMLAVYDDTGWNVAPAPPFGDPTYAEAAFYQVRLNAPAEQVVVGSGVPLTQTDAGQTHWYNLAAGPVRDFYLALSADYAVQSATIGETTVNSYAAPQEAAGAEKALETAVAALQFFSQRFGPYPYTELDIVATPTLALGIEYPGVIAITRRAYDPAGALWNHLETTVVHEVAHQWFYNLVGNDQLDEPWLDEALAQYATWLYLREYYGTERAQLYAEGWNGRWQQASRAEIPIGLPVSAYEGAHYSAIVYGRGPLFLEALAGELGEEAFDKFVRRYAAQHKWGIATTESFRQAAENTCGCDLGALFQEWVYPVAADD